MHNGSMAQKGDKSRQLCVNMSWKVSLSQLVPAIPNEQVHLLPNESLNF